MTATVSRRRRTGAIATLAAAGVALGGASTLSYFTDTEEITAGTVISGHLDLTADSVEAVLSAENMAPGDEVSAEVTLINTGTLPLDYTVAVHMAEDSPLGEVLEVSAHAPGADGDQTLHAQGLEDTTPVQGDVRRTLQPENDETVHLSAVLDAGYEDGLAGESVELVFTFDAEEQDPQPGDGPLMVTTWDTRHIDGTEITLPVSGNMDGTVFWGDGNTSELEPNVSHDYGDDGEYEVTIEGAFDQFRTIGGYGQRPTTDALVSVDEWGDTGTTSVAFYHSSNLVEVVEPPHTVTNMSHMFSGLSSFDQPLDLDTSNVTNMNSMFQGASSFNQPLDFDTSNVTEMTDMFRGASSFNGDLSGWDVSSAPRHARFDSNADAWLDEHKPIFEPTMRITIDTSKPTSVGPPPEFSLPISGNVRGWKVDWGDGTVATGPLSEFPTHTYDEHGEYEVSVWARFDNFQLSDISPGLRSGFVGIGKWGATGTVSANLLEGVNVEHVDEPPTTVKDMSRMFMGVGGNFPTYSPFNQDISDWDVSNVTNMSQMFSLSQFDQDISSWNVSSVTSMSEMFAYPGLDLNNPSAFNQDISGWYVCNVTEYDDFAVDSHFPVERQPDFESAC